MKKVLMQFQWNTETAVMALRAITMVIAGVLFSQTVMAAEVRTLGDVAKNITESFESITKLITAASYLGGLGFSIGAILKFKQHKDNPTQITIGTPIAMLFVAAALLFLPSILGSTGMTLFGTDAETAGPGGIIFTK